MDESISLNKFISDTGYCSRREADDLITSGRVFLNGREAKLGNRYKPGDEVVVDGSLVTASKKEKRVYLALNKPVGITTTTELKVKDNIISFVNYPKRIFPIGRLDKDSEGLIFLTNDGDIINKILRAGNNHEKEYIVRVNKPIDHAFVQQMSEGVPILDTRTLPCKVQMIGRQTFRITLTQGLNRQIRRMCEYLDYAVVSLQRIRIMNIKLDKLAVGKWRYLSEAEVSMLMEDVADSSKTNTKAPAPAKEKFSRPSHKAAHSFKQGEDKPSYEKNRLSQGKDKARDGKGKSGYADKTLRQAQGDKRSGKPAQGDKRNSKQGQGGKGNNKPASGEQKRGREKPAKGSFKDYRSKGRRS